MTQPLENILARLCHVRSGGNGYSALCPAHKDSENSLSISVGDDGRVLLKCFAGCTVEAIVAAIGLDLRDLFPGNDSTLGGSPGRVTKSTISVADLARDKCLPVEFLDSLGLEDRQDGVFIPYRNADGSLASRHRLRTALRAKDGSLWLFGKGKPVPYGLDRLSTASDVGYLVFVEGETDCWTLWYHGFPALGIPGASMTRTLLPEYLKGIERLFIFQEPDSGGETFVRGLSNQLATLRWKGSTGIVQLGSVKDPNDLHRRDPETFKSSFQDALDHARTPEIKQQKESIPSARSAGDSVSVLRESGLASIDKNASPESLDAALRRLVELSAGLDAIQRLILREVTIDHLRIAGFSAPAKMVDGALGVSHPDRDTDAPGGIVLLSDPDPWPEVVSGVELLDDIASTIARFVALPAVAIDTIALWVVHCYAIDATYISPMLAITSPVKRCGKSTLLELISNLVPRRLLASNITPAALFRAIESFSPTLLVDEADTFLTGHDELRGVLNSGHTRRTAGVVRTVGEKHEARIFSTWCPKAIAMIGKLPGTLEDRSIPIRMQRRTRDEKVDRLRRDRIEDELEPLRRKGARWTADLLEDLRDADPDVPKELNDRAQDNWRPLLAIADLVGDTWPERARQAATQLSGSGEEADSVPSVQLLEDLRDLFRVGDSDRLASSEILEALTSMDDRPWPEWKQGKPLTARQLSKLLKPFGVGSRTIRCGGSTCKGYLREDFQNAFNRYLPVAEEAQEPDEDEQPGSPSSSSPDGSVTSVTSAESQPNLAFADPEQPPPCDGSKTTEKGRKTALVTDVTDRKGRAGNQDVDSDPREEFDL